MSSTQPLALFWSSTIGSKLRSGQYRESKRCGTVFFILTGATGFMYLCGRLQEKYGPGRLTSIGAVLRSTSSIRLSQAGNMTDVNIWAFSVAASSAFVYLPGLTVVQCWYPEKRGLFARRWRAPL